MAEVMTMKQTGKKQRLFIWAALLVLLAWLLHGNRNLVITEYQIGRAHV